VGVGGVAEEPARGRSHEIVVAVQELGGDRRSGREG
jgi:hypothetical protein